MPGIYNLSHFILLFLFFYVKGSSTYLGAASIVHCLENYKPHVVITSRVADASLFLAPMVQYSSLIYHSHVCYWCNALFYLILFMQGEHDEFVSSDIKLPLPFLSWFVYRYFCFPNLSTVLFKDHAYLYWKISMRWCSFLIYNQMFVLYAWIRSCVTRQFSSHRY